nr:NADH-ubiquinone oxidoreductase chain 4 [Tanacetum cinerariifolium]
MESATGFSLQRIKLTELSSVERLSGEFLTCDEGSSGRSRMMRKSHVRFPEKGVATYRSFAQSPPDVVSGPVRSKNIPIKTFPPSPQNERGDLVVLGLILNEKLEERNREIAKLKSQPVPRVPLANRLTEPASRRKRV